MTYYSILTIELEFEFWFGSPNLGIICALIGRSEGPPPVRLYDPVSGAPCAPSLSTNSLLARLLLNRALAPAPRPQAYSGPAKRSDPRITRNRFPTSHRWTRLRPLDDAEISGAPQLLPKSAPPSFTAGADVEPQGQRRLWLYVLIRSAWDEDIGSKYHHIYWPISVLVCLAEARCPAKRRYLICQFKHSMTKPQGWMEREGQRGEGLFPWGTEEAIVNFSIGLAEARDIIGRIWPLIRSAEALCLFGLHTGRSWCNPTQDLRSGLHWVWCHGSFGDTTGSSFRFAQITSTYQEVTCTVIRK